MMPVKKHNTQDWYKKAIWLYVILLLIEGALRKWFLPGLATPLLLIREPIVIVLTLIAFGRGLIKIPYILALVSLTSLSFFLSLTVGHQNLWTALYGLRIYLFHIPFIFVIAKVLDRKDVIQIGRFLLYISIPMTLLIIAQFYSPQSAWVNRGVGGDIEGAGFGGAMGYFRPPGTFSFTAGYVIYQLLVAVFLFYYLINNRFLHRSLRIPSWVLYVILVCYFVTIPYSISRTHFFQTLIVLAFMAIGIALHPDSRIRTNTLKVVPAAVIAGLFILIIGWADTSIEAFSSRFESASKSEGGLEGTLGNRYFGSLFRGLINDNTPFWGYGLGLGTNAGARLAGGTDGVFSFFNGEDEWVRMTSESGLLLGWMLIALRLYLAGWIALKAYQRLSKQKDMLPWMLTAGVLITLPQGQIGMPTNLGATVLLAGLALSTLRRPKKGKANDAY